MSRAQRGAIVTAVRVAKIIERTSAEGPHERLALWVAGCDLACPGCCNPELFDPNSGRLLDLVEIHALLDRAVTNVEGITVLGGEPLQQIEAVTWLLREAKARQLGTLLFTGYTLDEARTLEGFDMLWAHVDTLVDGRFDARRPDRTRRFIGSANQGLQHHTSRYRDPALWRGPARIEARVDPRGHVELHGLPRPVSKIARALKSR